MRFLFINAINPRKKIEVLYPPLGIGYLVSSIRKRFGKDICQFKVIEDDIEREIIDFKPDIVGISSVSQNYNRAIAFSKVAQKYGIPVICGGVHISMVPSSLTESMDVGVMGEGEETICDLFELFERKGRFERHDLRDIRGIIYWNDGDRIAATEKRALVEPLDRLAFPARDVLKIERYTYMFTARGCPYRCTFCSSCRFWDKVRLFSAEYVADEIEDLVTRYNVESIGFYDDIFPIDAQRVENIRDILDKKNILGRVSFTCSIRANMVHNDIIHLLKDLGTKFIGMGLESGCDETLTFLKGGHINIEDNKRAINIIKKHRISVVGSFIIGSPEESKHNILKTLRFVKRSRLDEFALYVLTPFPGTPIWDYAKSRGLVDETMDWDKLNVNFEESHDSAVILSTQLTRKEIWRLFLRFNGYRKRKAIYNGIIKAFRNPLLVYTFLMKKWNSIGKRMINLVLTRMALEGLCDVEHPKRDAQSPLRDG